MEATAITCPNCNAPIPQGDECKYCGTKIILPNQAAQLNNSHQQSTPDVSDEVILAMSTSLKKYSDAINETVKNRGFLNFLKLLWAVVVAHTFGILKLIMPRPYLPERNKVEELYKQMGTVFTDMDRQHATTQTRNKYPEIYTSAVTTYDWAGSFFFPKVFFVRVAIYMYIIMLVEAFIIVGYLKTKSDNKRELAEIGRQIMDKKKTDSIEAKQKADLEIEKKKIVLDTVGLYTAPVKVTKTEIVKDEYQEDYRTLKIYYTQATRNEVSTIRFNWCEIDSPGYPISKSGYEVVSETEKKSGVYKYSLVSDKHAKIILAWPTEVFFRNNKYWRLKDSN